MCATLFEFRNRSWIITATFVTAFELYRLDHVQSGAAVAEWLARHFQRMNFEAWLRAVFIFAAAMLVISAALRTWGTSYLQTAVMQSRTVRTERLLADGPFRHVRNPLYLGNIFMAVGVGLAASRVGFVFLMPATVLFLYRLILREEAELAATQGDSYRAYCAAVPRLWFSIRARVASAGNQAHWLNGILGEMFIWALAAGATVYAATYNMRIYWGIALVGFVGGRVFRAREAGKGPQLQA
jgi:protein-S-isoprenylcysteine O-methyltransferase Ste14